MRSETHITSGALPEAASDGAGAHSRELRVSGSRLTVRTFRTWEELVVLQPVWNELLKSSACDSAFLTWEWISSWRAAYGPREIFVLACFSNEELLGIAPFYFARWPGGNGNTRLALSVLRFFGDDSGDCGSLDFIIRRGAETQVVDCFLRSLERSTQWDALELNYLPDDSPVWPIVNDGLDARNWNTRLREWPHMVLPLPKDWERFLASLSKGHRSALSDSFEVLEKRKLSLRRCETITDLPVFIDHLVSLHAARWLQAGKQGAFVHAPRSNFYLELGRQLLPQGLLDFWVLELDDVVVAAEFGILHGASRISMQSGFDPVFRKLGIGTVLDAKLIQRAIASGLKWYDFLGGRESFKRRWGAEERSYRFIRCARPRTLGSFWVQLGKSKLLTSLRKSLP